MLKSIVVLLFLAIIIGFWVFRYWTYDGEYSSLEDAKKRATHVYCDWIEFYEKEAAAKKLAKQSKVVWWFP